MHQGVRGLLSLFLAKRSGDAFSLIMLTSELPVSLSLLFRRSKGVYERANKRTSKQANKQTSEQAISRLHFSTSSQRPAYIILTGTSIMHLNSVFVIVLVLLVSLFTSDSHSTEPSLLSKKGNGSSESSSVPLPPSSEMAPGNNENAGLKKETTAPPSGHKAVDTNANVVEEDKTLTFFPSPFDTDGPMQDMTHGRSENRHAKENNRYADILHAGDKHEHQPTIKQPSLSDALGPTIRNVTKTVLAIKWSTWAVLPVTSYMGLYFCAVPSVKWQRFYRNYKAWIRAVEVPIGLTLIAITIYFFVPVLYFLRDVGLGLFQALILYIFIFAPNRQPTVRGDDSRTFPPVRSVWAACSSLVFIISIFLFCEWI